MVAGHYNSYTEAGLLPRTNALAQPAFNMTKIRGSHVMPSYENLKVEAPGQSWFIFVLDLPAGWELWCSFLCISIHPSSAMTRKQGRPCRGSAWYTYKEQRQRRQNLEHALSMATSILRQRASVDRLALHATITEPVIEHSTHTLVIEPGSCLKGGATDEFPTCYVKETLCLEDFAT
jgi:hypothetical protein